MKAPLSLVFCRNSFLRVPGSPARKRFMGSNPRKGHGRRGMTGSQLVPVKPHRVSQSPLSNVLKSWNWFHLRFNKRLILKLHLTLEIVSFTRELDHYKSHVSKSANHSEVFAKIPSHLLPVNWAVNPSHLIPMFKKIWIEPKLAKHCTSKTGFNTRGQAMLYSN